MAKNRVGKYYTDAKAVIFANSYSSLKLARLATSFILIYLTKRDIYAFWQTDIHSINDVGFRLFGRLCN